MAGADGPAANLLMQRLQEKPYAYDFFHAVRLIERAHPELPPVGHSEHPSDDPLRFCQRPSLAFAPSSIDCIVPGEDDRPARMFVSFFGLLGPHGPMPLHITEYIKDREREKDFTLARFLDMFHHRFICFFYRAWACNQQTVNWERGGEDRFGAYVGSLFGIGMEAFRGRDAVPDVAKLHYAGRLMCPSRNADGLKAILEDFFEAPVAIREFVGEWVELPEESRCRLGESPETCSLGTTAIVGSRVWECQHRFRIRIGPMSYKQYEGLLPQGVSLARLVAWVRNYVGDELRWDVQLVLKAAEVQPSKLGMSGRLGWTTWMGGTRADRELDDVVLGPFPD